MSDEIAIHYRVANGSIQLAWFENDVDNLIQYDSVSNQTLNIEQEISGVELVIAVDVAGIQQSFAYSWIDTENTLTGQRLVRRPENTLNGAPRIAGISYRLISRLTIKAIPIRVPLPAANTSGFTLWGVGTSYQFSSALTIRAKVDNLFDKKYQSNASYTTAGVNFGLSLSYRPQ
ncbi:vitamin B12 transporter BtuB [Alishewanella longhuensis]